MSHRVYMSGPAAVTVYRTNRRDDEGRLLFSVSIDGLARRDDGLFANYSCTIGLPHALQGMVEDTDNRWSSMARAALHFAIADGFDGDAIPYDEFGVLVFLTRST